MDDSQRTPGAAGIDLDNKALNAHFSIDGSILYEMVYEF